MAKISIQIRIDPDLLDWVDEQGNELDRSRSWIINHLVRLASQKDNEEQHP